MNMICEFFQVFFS